MHENKLIWIALVAGYLGCFTFVGAVDLPTNNTALQYLTNSTESAKRPNVAADIKKHIKDAWEKDPILSQIEVFQKMTNQLGSKRTGIVAKRRHRHRPASPAASRMLHHMIHGQSKRGRKRTYKVNKRSGRKGFKRTKYLDISLKLAKADQDKPDYQVTLVPKRPEQQPSASRQEQVDLMHHYPPYKFLPLNEHHEFHYRPFFPGLQPDSHEPEHVQAPVQSQSPVQDTQHLQHTEEIQDEVNKLMRQSEALRMTAAKFESKAKELANEAEVLHHETVSSDGHMGQTVGESVAHTPVQTAAVENHNPVNIVQPHMCNNEQTHVQVQAEYPVYHIPCKTPEQPVVDYHRPEPPPYGVNPYEILTSDMLNENNYHTHIQHQRQKISPKSVKKTGSKQDKHYSLTISYGKRNKEVKTNGARKRSKNPIIEKIRSFKQKRIY